MHAFPIRSKTLNGTRAAWKFFTRACRDRLQTTKSTSEIYKLSSKLCHSLMLTSIAIEDCALPLRSANGSGLSSEELHRVARRWLKIAR